MRRRLLLGGVLLLAAATVGCSDPAGEGVGDADVHARIKAMTDCAELQSEFDIAMDNFDRNEPGSDLAKATVAYAETARKRMEALGC